MSALDRPAEPVEMARMGELLQEALDAGAVGMSSGLAYAPAEHAPPAEIEALAALLRPAGALYTTHMRNEGDRVLDSLEESFAVGRAAGVPVVISHHKTIGRQNFGRTAQTLPVIAAALAGQEIGLDAYPVHRLLDGADRGAGRASDKGAGHLVEERARSRPDANSPRSPPIGGSARRRRSTVCSRPGRSIGRWTRPMCSGCSAFRTR